MATEKSIVAEGRRLLKNDRASAAVYLLTGWIDDNPEDASAWAALAAAHFSLANWEKAEDAARQVLRLRPESARDWCNLGVILRKRGELTDAERVQYRALSIEPKYRRADAELAKLSDANRDADTAHNVRRNHSQAPRPQPEDDSASSEGDLWYYRIGNTTRGPVPWSEIGRLTEDAVDFSEVLVARPGQDTWCNAAVVQRRTGGSQPARKRAGETPESESSPPPRPGWLRNLLQRLKPLASVTTLKKLQTVRHTNNAYFRDEVSPATKRVWSALKSHISSLGLPTVSLTRDDVDVGEVTAHLAAPNCTACGGSGARICPHCSGESRLGNDRCTRCSNVGKTVCGCLTPYVFEIPDHAISGYIAEGEGPSGERRYASLVSPALASNWMPVEGRVWIGGIAFAGFVGSGLLIYLEHAIIGIVLALATAILVAGLIRCNRKARVVANFLVAGTLLAIIAVGLVLLLEVTVRAGIPPLLMTGILFTIAALSALTVGWLGRWFHPSVRGAFHAAISPLDRLSLKAIPMRTRLRENLTARSRRWRATVATVLMGLFVFVPIVVPSIPAVTRAFIAHTLYQPPLPLRTADIVAFTDPVLAGVEDRDGTQDLGAEASESSSLPRSSEADTEDPAIIAASPKMNPIQHIARSVWLNASGVSVRMSKAPDDANLKAALSSLSEHSRVVEPERLERLVDVLAKRGYESLETGDWRKAAAWWALIDAHFDETEGYVRLRNPGQPWRVLSASIADRQKRLLTERFLGYGRGSLKQREAWDDAAEGEVFLIIDLTLLQLGGGKHPALASSFSLRASDDVRTPLGFKGSSGCQPTLTANLSDSLGPHRMECQLVFSVPEDFETGELLLLGSSVATVADEQIAADAPGQ